MDLYNRLRDFISRVQFREDNLARNVKFRKAAFDKATADYSLAVGKGQSPEAAGGAAVGHRSGEERRRSSSPASCRRSNPVARTWRRSSGKSPPSRMSPKRICKSINGKIDQLHKALVRAGARRQKAAAGTADSGCVQQPVEDRSDLAAESDAELQLPRRGAVRSLQHLPPGHRSHAAGLRRPRRHIATPRRSPSRCRRLPARRKRRRKSRRTKESKADEGRRGTDARIRSMAFI